MATVRFASEATLDARPEDVYATIADYREAHPKILPDAFSDLQVEEGGYGAGTVIRFRSKLMGREMINHSRISEPEPGRVVAEDDIESPLHIHTTFTVDPADGGRKALVRIATAMESGTGLVGLIGKLLIPGALRPVYREELRRLEAVAREHGRVTA